MVGERNVLNTVRIKTLVNSEIQRQQIKNALYQMSVWNTFDPKIIHHIIGAEKSKKQGFGRSEISVEELVRVTAVSQQRKRKMMGQRKQS